MSASLQWSMAHPLKTSGALAMAIQHYQRPSRRPLWPHMTERSTAELRRDFLYMQAQGSVDMALLICAFLEQRKGRLLF